VISQDVLHPVWAGTRTFAREYLDNIIVFELVAEWSHFAIDNKATGACS
jgi:hypothetical protein